MPNEAAAVVETTLVTEADAPVVNPAEALFTDPVKPAATVVVDDAAAKAAADAAAADKAATDKAAADLAAAGLTDEQKAAAEKAAADKAAADKAAAEKAAARVVPEKYEFKRPDGVVADPEVETEFATTAKELGLTQEEAQRIYDIGLKNASKSSTAAQEALAAQVKSTQDSWLAASLADPEFGKTPAERAQNLKIAKDAIGISPEVRTLLNESKLGNHPEMIRWMFRVGQMLQQDKHVPGGRRPAIQDAAKKLYPEHA